MSLAFSFPTRVNERAARLVAAGVASLAVVALLTQQLWLPPLLALGFLLRVGWGPRFSPLGRLAVWAAPKLAEPRLVAGAPKRFAQGIGAALTLTAVTALFTGHETVTWGLLGVLVLFATLEAAFSFCMGCWVYGRLQHLGLFGPDLCEDCSVPQR